MDLLITVNHGGRIIYETEPTKLFKILSNKIAYPEYKKLIEEGLAFCS